LNSSPQSVFINSFIFLTSHLGIRLEKVERIVIFDEVTKMPNERENYEGIVKRELKEEWCDYIRREYEFSMAVCRSLASDFETFMKEARGELKEGQLFYRAVKSNIPPGVKTDEMSFKTVKLTIFSEDDVEDAKKSQKELLKNRIVRLTNEALEQGTLLTQADLSILLNASIKTIGRHIKQLLEEDIIVPTRGNRMDIGPGTSHKAKIVELYLKGYEFTDIKRNTRHSSESIARYLKEFARVAALHKEGYSLGQIRRITEHSERLVKEYLGLYERYKNDEDCKQRLGEILSRYSREKNLGVERARAMEVM